MTLNTYAVYVTCDTGRTMFVVSSRNRHDASTRIQTYLHANNIRAYDIDRVATGVPINDDLTGFNMDADNRATDY